jgi:biopolymer transport protein ExbB
MKIFTVVNAGSDFAVRATRPENPRRGFGTHKHEHRSLDIPIGATYETGNVEGKRRQPLGNDAQRLLELQSYGFRRRFVQSRGSVAMRARTAAAFTIFAPAALVLDLADASAQAVAPAGSTVDGVAPSSSIVMNLPRDLSPWSMFASADILVQAVMVGLAFASLVTWTVWLAKTVELFLARRRLRVALAAVSAARSLPEAAARIGGRTGVMQALINAAVTELRMSSNVSDKGAIKDRVATRLARLEVAAARNMNKGTGVLATIGATAPFIGLFGTVWGIMNSFIGISKAQTTNLAVVAPGIAEALLATAIGLFAAIPAVVIYNQFARSIAGYRALVGDASAEVLGLVSRDLDRMVGAPELARAAE